MFYSVYVYGVITSSILKIYSRTILLYINLSIKPPRTFASCLSCALLDNPSWEGRRARDAFATCCIGSRDVPPEWASRGVKQSSRSLFSCLDLFALVETIISIRDYSMALAIPWLSAGWAVKSYYATYRNGLHFTISLRTSVNWSEDRSQKHLLMKCLCRAEIVKYFYIFLYDGINRDKWWRKSL